MIMILQNGKQWGPESELFTHQTYLSYNLEFYSSLLNV